MARKVLQVLESAYRCTLEEQDDPVVWLTTVLRGAGADTHLLLRGNAVNYAVAAQDASGLSLGGKAQVQPPRLVDDLARLMSKGAEIYLVEDDVAERGLERTDLIGGVRTVSRAGVARLFADHDQVWHW
jgi:sulfur transfer complex TusBCD TusB component (DsrH family)